MAKQGFYILRLLLIVVFKRSILFVGLGRLKFRGCPKSHHFSFWTAQNGKNQQLLATI